MKYQTFLLTKFCFKNLINLNMKPLFLLVAAIILTAIVSHSIAQPPVIKSFSPSKGPLGTKVTISGSGYDLTPSNNIVYFGAARADVSAATATSLTVIVPVGATYQPITALNTITKLSGASTSNFITTFIPKTGSINNNEIASRVDFPTLGRQPNSIAISDFDGDGFIDMAVTNDVTANISSFINNSVTGVIDTNSFISNSPRDFGAGNRPQSIVIGDIDRDGWPDAIVAYYGDNRIRFISNFSNFGYSLSSSYSSGKAPISATISDINMDGKPDLVVANAFGFGVSVLQNGFSSGTYDNVFTSVSNFTTGFQPVAVATGDIDGDGKPDVIVANSNTDSSVSLSILRNTATMGAIDNSSFAAPVTFTTGLFPRSLAIGDIDLDGKPDIVVVNQRSNTISVLRNTAIAGTITKTSLASKVDFTTGSRPRSVAITDIDGDGKPDIAVTNERSNSVSIFRNTSTPGSITQTSLISRVNFATGVQPYSVAIGDLDGDGRPDLAVANYKSNTVSVFRNEPLYNALRSQNNSPAPANTDTSTSTNAFSAHLYPVPATDHVTLQINNNTGRVAISLLDLTGKILWQNENQNQTTLKIPINNLPKGIYLVTVKDEKNSSSLKLIKN